MPALGHRGYFGIFGETVWGNGTPNAIGRQYMPVLSESLKNIQHFAFPAGIRATREIRRKVLLGIEAGGQISWEVDVEDGIGILLKNLLPNETFTDNGAGNGGKHVFVPGDANLPVGISCLIARDTTPSANNIWSFVGGRVKKMGFNAAEGQTLRGTADLDFKQGTSAAGAQTAAYTTQNPLIYHQGTITIAGASVNIKDFKLDIDSGLLTKRGTLGSQYEQQQQPMEYKISGEITSYFDDLTLVNDFINGTDANITLNFLGTALGTSTRQLKFEIPTAQFTGETPNISGPGEIMLKLPFTAYRSGVGNPEQLVQLTLLNSIRTVY